MKNITLCSFSEFCIFVYLRPISNDLFGEICFSVRVYSISNMHIAFICIARKSSILASHTCEYEPSSS